MSNVLNVKAGKALGIFLAVTCSVMASSRVLAVPCGFEHEVAKGDSLSVLSGMDMHYSVQDYWPILYSYNRDRLGNDPDLIYPGIMLRIPCLDENGQPLPGQFTESGGQNSQAAGGHVHNPGNAEGKADKKEDHDGHEDHASHTGTTADAKSAEPTTSEQATSEQTTSEQTASTETETAHQHGDGDSQADASTETMVMDEEKNADAKSDQGEGTVETVSEAPAADSESTVSSTQTNQVTAATPSSSAPETVDVQAESAPDAATPEPTAEPQQPVTVAKAEPSSSVTAADSRAVEAIRLLTADEFGLFNDKNTINAGVAMEIVKAALSENVDVNDFRISKVNDWSSHIDPLLSSHAFDVGFPWVKPDCSSANDLCDNFIFSKPIMEVANIFIVKAGSPISTLSADNIQGKTICRPSAFGKEDFDADGRDWLANSVITLTRPFNASECFDQLLADEVDAVSINEFHARSTINSLDIADQIKILDESPLPGVELFALVHRDHPAAQQLIAMFDSSIDAIRESGAYEQIFDQAKR